MYREVTCLPLEGIKKVQILTFLFKKTLLNETLDRAHPLNHLNDIVKAKACHLESSLARRDINGQHVISLSITFCSPDRSF